MKKLRRPGNSIPTWKIVCGIVLCVYGFGCFVAPTGMSAGVAIVTGIILMWISQKMCIAISACDARGKA